MKMYDVLNKNGAGMFVCANSEEEALHYALSHGHARATKNLKVLDVTDCALKGDKTGTLQFVLEGEITGQLSKNLTLQQWEVNK